MQIFLTALIAGLCKAEVRILGMTMISRPLVVSTLIGLVYGDVQTGLIFGAQMELLSMGLVGIGAHSGMPEITLGSAICTAFICGSGTGSDVALTLSLPISTFAASLGYLTWVPLNHLLSEKAKKAAAKADTKTMELCQWGGLFNYFFFPFVLVLVALIAGSPVFEWLIKVIPTWITSGISAASGLLPALGFALLMQLTFSWKLSPYLFIGFVAVAFFNLSNVGVAIIGVILAVLAFNQNSESAGKDGTLDDNEI
ncbi:MAG: PTS sugar transporter subunit IIC [Bulleidia sp.]|nr:PTS sugar transporter subunit IIC [Bulleidia sp.]